MGFLEVNAFVLEADVEVDDLSGGELERFRFRSVFISIYALSNI